jgi:ABC-type Fe3+/spermidine/putrescine transport system ATPase subunit
MVEIQIQNLKKRYGDTEVLRNINVTIHSGELLVIMGPSGCGKTTLLLSILGAKTPDGGEIRLDQKSILTVPMEERNIGYVPQDFGLFPHLTVAGNIAFGLKIRHIPAEEREKEITRLISLVDLHGLENRFPKELSGGQKQRVALARALAIHPPVLLLDEPLNSIDEAIKEDVIRYLRDLVKTSRVTTICVAHNPEDAFELGDRIAIMYHGEILQVDTPLNLLKSPKNAFVKKIIAPMYLLWAKKPDFPANCGID